MFLEKWTIFFTFQFHSDFTAVKSINERDQSSKNFRENQKKQLYKLKQENFIKDFLDLLRRNHVDIYKKAR